MLTEMTYCFMITTVNGNQTELEYIQILFEHRICFTNTVFLRTYSFPFKSAFVTEHLFFNEKEAFLRTNSDQKDFFSAYSPF